MQAASRGTAVEFLRRGRIRKVILFHLILGPRTPSELATMESKHLSHVSRALGEMKKQGLVEYLPSARSRERLYRATEFGYVAFVVNMRNNR